jgi:hypothetical protein
MKSIFQPIQHRRMKWKKKFNYYQYLLKDQIVPKITIKPLKSSFKSEKRKNLDPS